MSGCRAFSGDLSSDVVTVQYVVCACMRHEYLYMYAAYVVPVPSELNTTCVAHARISILLLILFRTERTRSRRLLQLDSQAPAQLYSGFAPPCSAQGCAKV